jgi:hypothetical protein
MLSVISIISVASVVNNKRYGIIILLAAKVATVSSAITIQMFPIATIVARLALTEALATLYVSTLLDAVLDNKNTV